MPNISGFQVNEILTAANTNTYLLRPYRNAIINGAMNIAQRSTSVAGITSDGFYTADRWKHSPNSLGTWTDTVQNISANDAPLAEGLRNSWKTTCTTANASPSASAFHILVQNIEGNRCQQFAKGNASAKPFALSFWVRSNRTGTYIAELLDQTNFRSVSASYTIDASGSWQKVRLLFPADTTGAIANDNNAGLTLFLWLGAGTDYTSSTLQTTWGSYDATKRAAGQVNLGAATSNYFEVTGVQLEPNNVCTPYEVLPAQDDLVACWRYFQRHNQPSMRGVCAAGFTRMALHYGIPMRALPTATSNGGTMGYWDGVSAAVGTVTFIGSYSFSNTTIEFDISSSGWTARAAAVFYQISTNTFIVDLNAEL